MMLETTATRLWCEPGGPHYGSPDKEPAVRLRVLEDAGRSNVPFTTGILIGIGETYEERADSLFALRRMARALPRHPGSHRAELPRQAGHGDARHAGRRAGGAGRHASRSPGTSSAPRPASRPRRTWSTREYALLIGAGIDDWGGVSPLTPDHVNPERPWPQIEELAAQTADAGLRAARTAHDLPGVHPARRALAGPAAAAARAGAGRPGDRPRARGREPGGPALAGARRGLHAPPAVPTCTAPSTPRAAPPTAATTSTRCTATGRRCARRPRPAWCPQRIDTRRASGALRRPPTTRRSSPTTRRSPCCTPTGPALDALCRIADDLRRDVVGDDVTYIVTRNINFTNVCYTGCRFCAFAQRRTDADAYTLSLDQVADRAAAGVGRRRGRGLHAGRHPPGPAGHRLLRHRARGEGARPRHARARLLPDGGRQRRDPHRACPSASG